MYEQTEVEIDGVVYNIEFFLNDDELNVILPNGEIRMTVLRGLSIETAIRPHLISYLKSKNQS